MPKFQSVLNMSHSPVVMKSLLPDTGKSSAATNGTGTLHRRGCNGGLIFACGVMLNH